MKDEKFNIELERAIAENPDDASAFAVYADWLHEHGSPRGELASVQLAREQKPKSKELEKREEALMADHATLFRGPANERGHRLDERCSDTQYKGGFWRSVSFSGAVEVLAELLAHPSARLLHSLAIGYLGTGHDEQYEKAIETIANAKTPLEVLRVLRIGDMPEGQSSLAGFNYRTTGDLGLLVKNCPRLEVVRMLCPGFEISKSLPFLRVLDARLGTTPAAIASFTKVKLPRLEELHIGALDMFTDDDEDEDEDEEQKDEDSKLELTDKALDLLGRSAAKLPALKKVCIWPWSENLDGDDAVERIQGSKLGAQLESVTFTTDLESDDDDGCYQL